MVTMKERPSQFQEPSVDGLSNICQKCGRVKRAVKSGSLTSWIFAESRCRCEDSTNEFDLKVVDSQPGSVQFNDFEMQNLVGHGGMGSVFKVLEKSSGNTLAIKLMKEELVKDSVSVKRFEQEVQACMSLSHPNLINVHGFGRTEDGKPYLIMDYIEGKSLQELLAAEGLLEVDRALAIFINVCSAISVVHENGIVHRDIKPSNIMILKNQSGQEEQVKVLDFGIARVVRADPIAGQTLTSTGEIFGSPLYMSPEQCKGEEVDTRSDIYSLGCVLYETLSGKPPFQGKNPIQTILKHLHEDEPDSLISKKLGVSASLHNVVLKCLAKDPRDRYANVDELRRDLKYVRAGLDPNVKIVKSKQRRSREQRIKRIFQVCLATLISITTVYLLFLWMFRPADINSLTQAINQNPNDIDNYLNRAELYAEDQLYRQAMSDLNTAIRIQPNSYFALRHRASLHTKLKEYKKAIADASAAINLRPDLEMAYIERARANRHLENYDAAIKDSTRALKVNPNNSRNNRLPAYYNRADCYLKLSKYELGLKDCQSALDLMSNSPDTEKQMMRRGLLNLQSKALLGLARTEEALAASNSAVLCDGKSYESLFQRAAVLGAMGRFAEADKDLTTLVELFPQSEYYYNLRAQNRLFMGTLPEAIEDMTSALEKDPSRSDLYYSRAFLYYVSGDYKLAIADLNRFLELSNWKGVPANYALIKEYYCYRLLNDRASAERILKEYPPKLEVKSGWTITVFKYLEGKLSDNDLLKAAGNDHRQHSDARSFIGVTQYLNGHLDEATSQFNFVISKADKNELEIPICKAMLAKIQSRKAELNKR